MQDQMILSDRALAQAAKPQLSAERQAAMPGLIEEFSELAGKALGEVSKDIIGQDAMIRQTMTCIASGGHFLAEGVPGLGKTLTVSSFSKALGLATKRIQFTSDLTPADILGGDVIDRNTNKWVMKHGPVFAQLVLADEINRAPGKTQSAMLEVMQEYKVTINGEEHLVPSPFMVMATQNPIDDAGTYPLPYASLDRLLMRVIFNYGSAEDEKQIALRESSNNIDIGILLALRDRYNTASGADKADIKEKIDLLKRTSRALQARQALSDVDLMVMQALARDLTVGDKVATTVTNIVRALRPQSSDDKEIKEMVNFGPSPRGQLSMLLALKAQVLVSGYANNKSQSPLVTDIGPLLEPVLAHRMVMNHGYEARDIISHIRKKFPEIG